MAEARRASGKGESGQNRTLHRTSFDKPNVLYYSQYTMAHFLTLTYRQFNDRFDELLALTWRVGELRVHVPSCMSTVILRTSNDQLNPLSFTILYSS